MSRERKPGRIAWRSRRERRRETEQEIEAHLRMRIDDLILKGHSPEEARERAMARFGNVARARADIEAAARRRDRRLEWSDGLDRLRRDLVLAGRRMRSQPGHASLIVMIFGLGIGLTTVMYSLVDRVLLRPLPFPESERLVALESVPESGGSFPQVSMGNWYDWREGNRTLESTALYGAVELDATIATGEAAFTVPSVRVAGPFFETLRPPFVAGVAPSEAIAEERSDLVVVSEGFWRRVLGGDPRVQGRTIVVDGDPREIAGVLRAGYELPEGVDLWMPQRVRAWTGAARNNINYRAMARLAPGVTRERAAADLSTIADGIRARDPEGVYSWGVGVRPLHETVVGGAGTYLWMLMGAVALVLLVACANLAALGFARGHERAGDVALRLSIGASRARIVRQLLTEDLALASLGGLLGIGLAWAGTGPLVGLLAGPIPRLGGPTFDAGVLAAGLVVSLVAGTLVGLPPALGAARRGGAGLIQAVKSARHGRSLPGALLVGGQVAMTVVLLTGSTLLLMSLRAVTSRDLGYDPSAVLTLDVTLVSPEYRGEDHDRALGYWDGVREALLAGPDTERVGLGNWIPTGGGGTSFVELDDRPPDGAGAGYRVVSEDYFETLRIPILRGRGIQREDVFGGEPVAVINQAMADEFWPSVNPIGRRVRAPSMEDYFHGGEAPWRTIVGVVGNIRHGGFESEARAEMYVPHRQMPWMARAMTAVVRVRSGQAGARMGVARARVQALDPDLAVEAATLEDRLGLGLRQRRLISALLLAFACASLGLASLGVYSVLSFAVKRRRREVAIRSALGAPQGRILRLVLAGALRVVLVGTAVGIALAVAARGVLEALLVEVSSLDPVAYAGAGVFLLLVVVTAGLIPAHRAARLDPLEALRDT